MKIKLPQFAFVRGHSDMIPDGQGADKDLVGLYMLGNHKGSVWFPESFIKRVLLKQKDIRPSGKLALMYNKVTL